MKILYRTNVIDDFGEAVFYDVTSYPSDTLTVSEDVNPDYLTHCKPLHENGKYSVRHSTQPLTAPQRTYQISHPTAENLLLVFMTPETYYEAIE